MKKCIFHYPSPLNYNKTSGSAIRPIYMLNAFKECGYYVEEVIGYGKERKEKIKKIMRDIDNGEIYDFVYSESMTQPTLLTEHNHLPTHPFLDFRFLRYCKKNDIPVGLFYRDMYWKFDQYKEIVPLHKRMILIPFFKYDIQKYKQCVDILYCPNKKFASYGLEDFNIKALPPGCKPNLETINFKSSEKRRKNHLEVFYVGGISGFYDISIFLKGMQDNKNVHITICTPQEQWNAAENELKILMDDRVSIIHKSSDELMEYYKNADVSLLCKKNDPYTDIASPIKAKETLGYGTPIIISDNLAIAEEVVEGDYGWVVKPEPQAISELLNYLCKNPDDINQKTQNAIKAAENNTWKKRAEQVINDMKEIKVTN